MTTGSSQTRQPHGPQGRCPDIERAAGTTPFSYHLSKNGKVFISWEGRVVTTLNGSRARKFRDDVDGADEALAQLEMARVTGNFKRGNERLMGRRARGR